jgi:Family of unknown function (DUF6152)
MGRKLSGLSAVAALLLVVVPVSAHHAIQSQFDPNRPFKLTGVLTKVDWINPHVYFYLDVKDDTGKVTNWALESTGPAGLRNAGLSRSGFFKVGDTYTVTAVPSRDGWKSGFIRDIKFPDGRVVTIWFSDPRAR